MFIELIDLLRCPVAHEDSWLVASFQKVSNRFVEEATLGCPVCSAQYPITDGIADFRGGAGANGPDAQPADVTSDLGQHVPSAYDPAELATRAGAFLSVTEPGATIVLGGSWAGAAEPLSDMADVKVLALNAPKGVRESSTVALIAVAADVPVAPGSCLGVAIDASFNAEIVASAIRAVRPGGRIVGPAAIEPPAGLSVLARDAAYWIAETPQQVVTLRRASR